MATTPAAAAKTAVTDYTRNNCSRRTIDARLVSTTTQMPQNLLVKAMERRFVCSNKAFIRATICQQCRLRDIVTPNSNVQAKIANSLAQYTLSVKKKNVFWKTWVGATIRRRKIQRQ
jgi:hypothetical protein